MAANLTQGILARLESIFAWTMVLSIIGCAVYFSCSYGGFGREAAVNKRLLETRARTSSLARENAILRLKIQDLRAGNRGLERAARERFGLVLPGEVVYEFTN
jgi:cell division protein FtsB